MSSKLGVILSSLFIVIAFLFSFDLINIQFIYADLDAKSVNISYLISRSPNLDAEFWSHIGEKYDVFVLCEKTGATVFGEEIDFELSQDYRPLIMSKENLAVSIKRTAIVGYFG